MTPRQRRMLAGALGAGLMALLLVLAAFDNLFHPDPRETLTTRTVELYEQPPSPPPPPARPNNARSGGSAGRELKFDTARAPVALDTMQLNVQLAVVDIGSLNLGGLGEGIGTGSGDGRGDGSGIGFGLTTFSELDQLPTVVSAPVFRFPDEAIERGLDEFDMLFHIIIDEQGFTYPVSLLESPFPSMNAEFMEWASRVRFSPPTRLGIPVRTEYKWPVTIRR